MLKHLINRNLLLLFGCQVVFVSGTVTLVTIGGIAGHEIAPNPGLATLPVALMVVGTALATIPAAMSMQALGRKGGFLVGVGLAVSGALLAQWAIGQQAFVWFCIATALIGSSLAFSQHFRFAAAESVPEAAVSFAVSFLLIGSIIGAIAAPEIIAYSAQANAQQPYAEVFSVMLLLYAVAAVLVLGQRHQLQIEEAAQSTPRPLGVVVKQPMFVAAVCAGMVGQGVMTYVMTATPISMNVVDAFSLVQTSEVIRAHVIAMYLPSLVTPFLIARFGLPIMMGLGTCLFIVTMLIGLAGHHLFHYWWSMVLLGVGWNFLFVSGTTLLTQSYRPSERFRSQAVNDFGVFGASALASLLAGTVLHAWGWEALLYSAFPALAAMFVVLYWWRATRLNASTAAG